MAKVLVGRDATAYVVYGGGLDSVSSGFNAGAQIDFLGKWKDISIEFENEWVEVTPSSGQLKEKRRTVYDWKASLTNMVRRGGSDALRLILSNDYIQIVFTEDDTGEKVTLIGGISNAKYARGKEAATEDLNIENVGTVNGGSSIFYS